MSGQERRRPPHVNIPNDLAERMDAAGVKPDAAMLNVAAWCAASQWVNDGEFARSAVRRLPCWTATRERHLVDAGFWAPTAEGVALVGYLDSNSSREAIAEARSRMAAGGQRGGSERAASSQRDGLTGRFLRDGPEVPPVVTLGPSASASRSASASETSAAAPVRTSARTLRHRSGRGRSDLDEWNEMLIEDGR